MNKLQYLETLKNSKIMILPPIIKKNALGALSKSPPFTIAPLNTDISLGTIDIYKVTPSLVGVMAERPPPPESYFLKRDHKNGKLIESPRNQYSCGSCWAISAATIVGDCFVVKDLTDYSPMLSTTYILSTYPQNKCAGGNQVKVYDDIKVGGIPSEHCVDYQWCINDKKVCNPGENKQAGKEFTNVNQAMTYLNSIIPPTGCYFPDNKKLYYIKDIQNITPENPNDNSQLVTFRNLAKYHIMEEGPISAGYIVLENFIQGYRTNFQNTKGIYFEDIDYNSSQSSLNSGKFKMVGGHAVAVVGWGIEKNLKYNQSKPPEDIPYWYVRNSWGDKLADNGYFKIAMYPYNKNIGFDIPIDMPSGKGNTDKIGGFVLIKADRVEDSKIKQQIPTNDTNKLIIEKNMNFYKSDNTNSNNIKQNSNTNYKDYILYIIYICIGILVLFLIIYGLNYLYKSRIRKNLIRVPRERLDISNIETSELNRKLPESISTSLSHKGLLNREGVKTSSEGTPTNNVKPINIDENQIKQSKIFNQYI
jgi:hypothetical protein